MVEYPKNQAFHPKDDVVLVTGGAGQLGSALCKRFDELGNDVYMADIEAPRCEEKIQELDLSSTHPIEMDVTDVKSIRKAFSKIYDEHGRIDSVINNAGVAVFSHFRDRTPEDFYEVFDVNVKGTLFCCLEAIDYMESQGRGFIVNVGSIYGVVSPDPSIYGDSGINSSAVYGASKASIIQITKYMATHVDESISINCVSPGGIFNDQHEFFLENYREKTPKGRMATEDDLVDMFAFLCSDSARYITGQNITVDGGFTTW